MSGPKISYGRVSTQEYRRMQEKARVGICIEVCCDCADRIESQIGEVDSLIDLLEGIEEVGESAKIRKEKLLKEVQQFTEKYKAVAIEGRKLDKNTTVHHAEVLNEKLSKNVGYVKRDLNDLKKRIIKFQDDAVNKEINKNLNSSSYFFAFESLNKVYGIEEYIDKINNTVAEIDGLELSNSLERKLETIKTKANEITSGEYLHNFYQISVLPFVKECRDYDEFYQMHYVEYEALKTTCEVLAKELHVELEQKEFSNEALEYYRSKREELSEKAIESRKQIYLRECMDSAMEELGYTLVGTKHSVDRRGNEFHNQLYTYSEGTAVNVTFAKGGQITMELGGIDTIDRTPDYAESQQLVESMHTFCSDYGRIEDKLLEKGIVNERVSMMPAEEDFAQIINVSEYDLTQEVSKFNVSQQTVAQTQYMHKDGDQ